MSTTAMRISLWSPQYLVHDAEIDRQHQALFEPANRLHEAMLLGKGKEVLAEIVERAKRLVSEHNAYEERLMKDTHYPEYQEHVQQHAELARKARFLLERFECGETTMTIELALFFSPSIKHHVMKHDRRLAEYLNARSSAPLFDGRAGDAAAVGARAVHDVVGAAEAVLAAMIHKLVPEPPPEERPKPPPRPSRSPR